MPGGPQPVSSPVPAVGPFAGDFLALPPYQGTRGTHGFGFGTPNKLAVLPFTVDRVINLKNSKVSVQTLGAVPGIFYYVGIYNSTETLVTWSKTPCGSADATGIIEELLVSAVTLFPGNYLLATGTDDPDTGESDEAQGGNYDYNGNGLLMQVLPGSGIAADEISGGQMPVTLGTVSGQYPYSAPFVVMF